MAAVVHHGNVFDVLPTLGRGLADVVVTSPPYWKLRSYLPKDHPLKPLELGSEATPDCGMGGRSRMELRKDLSVEEFEYVVRELRKVGLL